MQNRLNDIFFELIRVSVGVQGSLSCVPSEKSWQWLYNMAQKQSLVGVCFVGVQRLCDSDSENYCGMTEQQFLTWMGMAARIQDMNREMDGQCVQLQAMLAEDGMRSCLLKGQTAAMLYDGDLVGLRQSGDIDVWVDAPQWMVTEWAVSHGSQGPHGSQGSPDSNDPKGSQKVTGRLHVACNVFPETDVELHFTPSLFSSPAADRRLQKWFEICREECMTNRVCLKPECNLVVTAPTVDFNLVYLLHHAFRHYLFEGVGLRHVMDYYMALRRSTPAQRSAARQKIRELGMESFAGAMMWVMAQVFGMGDDMMVADMDSRRGERLLEVIMEGGNFGHDTQKYKVTGWDKPFSRLSRYVRRNWFMLRDYPWEILWNVVKKL